MKMKSIVEDYITTRLENEGLRNPEPILTLIKDVELYLKKELKKSDLRLIGSSGASIVIIIAGLPYAFQHYPDKRNYDRVTDFVNGMNKNSTIDIDLEVSSGFGRHAQKETISVVYELSEYLVQSICMIFPLQTIIWELVDPLQTYNKDFIEKNLYKIMWDLGKSLTGIHQNGFIHVDSRLDNSAIKEGKFIFFDFDMSKRLSDNNGIRDFRILLDSLEFRLDRKINIIPRNFLVNVIKYVKLTVGLSTFKETVDYLNDLIISF